MKRYNVITFLIGLLFPLTAASETCSLNFGNAVKFNDDWKFILADSSAMSLPDYDDSRWRQLDLPHDWSIEGRLSPSLNSCTGYLPGGIAWYRKTFGFTPDGQNHFIYFEGIYNRSEVYLNGHLLGKRPNGYVSFYYDLTPYLKEGENVMAVRVDHSREADSRWYTGSGIYRDSWMVTAGDTRWDAWGTGWKATSITDRKATIEVDVKAVGPSGKGRLKAVATITDADGNVVARKSKNIAAGERSTINMAIADPRRWDIDSPYLYTLVTRLYDNGREVDRSECRIGLRTLEFDPDNGFAINGRNIKVKGVCLHHDAGVLGAVVPRDVWARRLDNLKAIGANAIRMSHNPQAPMLYDLCDEKGFLVMDEGSDEWEFPKRKWVEGWNKGTPKYEGSYDFFEEWIETDVADMVRRDRNHPSIFLWSVGNEVDYPNDPYSHPVLDGKNSSINQPMYGGYNPDAPDAARIGEIAKRLAAVIRGIDDSRPVTGALAGVVMSNETEYPRAVDVVGYNYTENRYAEDHAAYPDRIIYGSENGQGFDAWKAVRDNDYIFGQFIWTGTDYLGESGQWPSRGLNTGLLDFGSFPKPRGHFRAALWCDRPVTYVGAYPVTRRSGGWVSIDAPAVWNHEPGQTVRVVSYTNAPAARLELNGRQVGDTRPHNDTTGIIHWDIPFEPGTLVAHGVDTDGTILSSDTIVTSGRPAALRITALGPTTLESHENVAHVLVEVVDDNGNPVTLADNNITCRIEGGTVKLLGLEGSDNTDMGDYRDNRQRVYGGRLLAYLAPVKNTHGPSTVKFTSPLLNGGEITINVK
ncbi:MAG: DUF4982 domain-containing protein [Duncaniella sp.]|nr:DUF4982 domain-containing protein [Duncaniella sp.]HBI58844.1 glycoside hydrolase family 2 [Porphyromonadaceae bacterium]